MGKLQQMVEQQRLELLKREQAASGRVVSAYGAAWKRVAADVDALVADVDARRARGEAVTLGQLGRLERLRALKTQVAEQLRELAGHAGPQIAFEQRAVIAQSGKYLKELVAAAAGRAPAGGAAVLANWNSIPKEALAHLAGALADGSPLADLLAQIAGDGARGFGEALTTGLALGLSPRAVAASAQKEFGTPLARTLTIARTETLRTYREATRQELMANQDLVAGWTWHAHLDRHTCAACWAMHGTKHEPDDTLDGHPNCRCAMVPLTRSWEELGFEGVPDTRPVIEPGLDLFDQAGEQVQREVLGPAAFEQFSSGKLKLVDLLVRRDDPDWGTMRYARSLKQVALGGGGDQVGLAALGTGPLPELSPSAVTPSVAARLEEPPLKPPLRLDTNEATDKWGQDLFDQIVGDWDEKHRRAVETYTSSSYIPINKKLRGVAEDLRSDLERTLGDLDDLFAKPSSRLPEAVVTYRGIGEGGGWEKLGPGSVGEVMQDLGFVSTSPSFKQAEDFSTGMALEITVPQGASAIYVDPISVNRGERELLLPRGSRFLVRGVSERALRRGGRILKVFEVEVISE